jgi:hypothetical protein
MKRTFAVLGMVLLAALLILPGTAKSEMYVEGYFGGVAASSDSQTIKDGASNFFGTTGIEGTFSHRIPGRFDNPFFTGGMKLGIWFDRTGVTGGYNWPDWMKYFGFYLDASFHNLDFKPQTGTSAINWTGTAAPFAPGVTTGATSNLFWSDGRVFTLAFMFGARYGFLPDSEVPFGRLQPYIAVGPALLISSQDLSFRVRPYTTSGPGPGLVGTGVPFDTQYNLPSKTSTDIALAVDAGLRYYALKNVSIDVFFKYRWAEPSYKVNFTHPVDGSSASFDFQPTYHLFSGNVGVAYHF